MKRGVADILREKRVSNKRKRTNREPGNDEYDELRSRARTLHFKLFPEEYDHQYDSSAEANARSRGMNPMGAAYIERTNRRRAALGFEAFQVEAPGPDTLGWVLERLQAGMEEELTAIKARRDKEDARRKLEQESERQKLQTPAWQNQKIDAMLASDAFLFANADRDDADVMAVRILGALFQLNPAGASEGQFHDQIRRVLPGKTDADYADLYRRAKDRWMDVYGY